MKRDVIFRFAETNAPRDGMTISETLFMTRDEHVSIFSLGSGTDISAERYPRPFLYIGLDGRTGVGGSSLGEGAARLFPAHEEFGVSAGTGCVFLEIETEEFNMNLIRPDEVFALKDVLPYEEGKIVNADIVNNQHLKFALMSFDAGCATPEHAAPGEAVFFCLDGECVITNEGVDHHLHAGDNFAFRPGIMHKVSAVTKFKMAILIVKG